MTLMQRLKRQINASGPISISDYMSACLTDPDYGYYNRSKSIGLEGAFTTAPEISQMFGELIGLWLSKVWQDQGSQNPMTIAELGAGRGNMLVDIMRAGSKVTGFTSATEMFILESSCTLKNIQQNTLSEFKPHWIDSIHQLPKQPLFLVANEFFDALPVQQFRRTKTGWSEIRVGVTDDQLEFCEIDCGSPKYLESRTPNSRLGDVVEIRPDVKIIVGIITKVIREYGGAALIIDYGDKISLGDTLQAVKSHKYAPLLTEPGESDVSAHVDFGALMQAAVGVQSTELVPQGVWLERMGITTRAQMLAKSLNGEALDEHISGFRRLVHPEEMGNLFKVLGLYPKGTATPPGFYK